MENKEQENKAICMSQISQMEGRKIGRRRRLPRTRRLFLTAIDGTETHAEAAGNYWMCSRFIMP